MDPPLPSAAAGREQALERYRLRDPLPELALDDLTALAAQICGAPIALISLMVDGQDRITSSVGLAAGELSQLCVARDAVDPRELFIVPDAAREPRLADDPMVTGAEHLRFYAAAPLVSPEGHVLGVLCVMDRVPRGLTRAQQDALWRLSRQVMAQLELRRHTRALAETDARLRIVTENARVGLAILNADRTYAYANRTYAEVLGLPSADLAGQRLSDALADVYDEQLRPPLDQAFAGERVTYEFRRPDIGDGRTYRVQYEPTAGERGEPLVVVVLTEVTDRRRAEDSMRLNHERFQIVSRATNDAVWDWDLQSNRLGWNEGFQASFGYAPDSIDPTVASWSSAIHPDDATRVVTGIRAVIDSQSNAWSDEYRFRRRDGTYADVLDRGYLIRDPQGAPMRMVGAMQDITQRKRAEAAQRAARDLLTGVIDSTPSYIFATDRQHRYTLVNQAYARFLERTPEVIVGALHGAFFPPAVAASFVAVNEAIMASGEGRQIEETILGAALMTTKFPMRDAQGVVIGLVGVITDITERNLAVEALRDAEERVRFALESADAGIWDLDYATGALRWSEIMEAQFGLAPRTFGGTFEEFVQRVHAGDRDALRKALDRASTRGGDFSLQHRAVAPDGTVRWLSGTGRVHLDEHGRPIRGVGISLDVTDKRTLEAQYQQAQKMEAIGRLAGGVAHDFNNLLTAILGYCELLHLELDPEDDRQASITQIQQAGQSAAALTRQLLAFSRKQVIEPVRLDLNGIVSGLRPMIGRLIGEDVEVALTLQDGLAPVLADRGQIEQIVMNLVVNARDAMPTGGVLTIETANVEVDSTYARTHLPLTPGPHVVLTTTDTGTGMTADVQARLFEPFFTTKEMGKGTGLGLATVHGVVASGGGRVDVVSEVGHGSAIAVYLPAAREEPVTEEAPAVPPRTRPGTETVLVVEDADALRELTRRLLLRQGYQVLVASGAEEATQLFEANAAIDVLLTDVIMPGASGPELARQLLARRPALKVIYMSGYTDDLMAEHGVLTPHTVFLQKPFSAEVLGRKLREALDR